jgi:CxxC motif-containing protein (DUF1111 family)
MRVERSLQLFLLPAVALAMSACGASEVVDAAPVTEEQHAAALAAADPAATQAAAAVPAGATEASTASPGDPLPGLSAAELARFQDGRAEFTEVEDVSDGLGPVFNDDSCAACHSVPAIGGGSTRLETRFGRRTGGSFDPLADLGGSLLQEKGIGIAGDCNYVAELVPAQANVSAGRRTTPLLGLGLVDAVPDGVFTALAFVQRVLYPRQAGRVGMVQDIASGRSRPGRFGWKGQVPSLHQFAGDAYLNEMGITNPEFPGESCPQGDCSLLRCNPVPALNDDGAGIVAFRDFMTFLAPPAPARPSAAATRGRRVFQTAGCARCHVETLATGSSPSPALSRRVFHPYSDFLLHDMGSLGDGIALGAARGSEFRTAPLWGLRYLTTFLHDGRAATIPDAIGAHDGQAGPARDAYQKLGGGDRGDLQAFLETL